MKRLLLLFGFLVVVPAMAPRVAVAPVPPARTARPAAEAVQPNAFYDAAQFATGLRAVGAVTPGPGRLAGGVVPHHILAGVMLSTFFAELEAHPPRTLIVVGPNHPNAGQPFITGRRAWATDFGRVEVEQGVVDRLVAEGLATVDDEVLADEHSVGALMPYLKYHAPQAKVVPIIIHKGVTRKEMERLAEFLVPLVRDGRTLVASVDFSHYLTRAEAEVKDVETQAAMEAFDLDGLLRMGPDHLDSPASLGVVMLTMQKLQAAGPELAAHTNAGVLIGNDMIETTSYFTFKYRVK